MDTPPPSSPKPDPLVMSERVKVGHPLTPSAQEKPRTEENALTSLFIFTAVSVLLLVMLFAFESPTPAHRLLFVLGCAVGAAWTWVKVKSWSAYQHSLGTTSRARSRRAFMVNFVAICLFLLIKDRLPWLESFVWYLGYFSLGVVTACAFVLWVRCFTHRAGALPPDG